MRLLLLSALLLGGCIWHLPGYCNPDSYACPSGQVCNRLKSRCERADGGAQ